MYLFYIRALHIIFIVTWFAGLFYIVRLFIYHIEAEERSEAERKILQDQYKIMERRLWYGITWPSMILTILTGGVMLWPYLQTWDWEIYSWLAVKLALALGLIVYHIQCGQIFKKLQNDIIKYTSGQLRIWNEVATVFLVSIVFLVELKNALSWIWGLAGLIAFSGLLLIAIKIYKNFRTKN